MIERDIFKSVINSLDRYPAAAITGGRQVGKTTLARQIEKHFNEQRIKDTVYLDLELPSDLEKIKEPELFLSGMSGKLVIIDEAQRKPDLFPVLRALIDQDRIPGRFLLTGSASPSLIQNSSESLAGRIKYHELGGISIREIENSLPLKKHWFAGGYPPGLLAEENALGWKQSFIQSYLEREILYFHLRTMPMEMQRFWTFIAHSHGRLLNLNALSKSMGISNVTAKRYFQFLEGTFMVRSLPPWHENLRKRLVKSPKIFVRDSGILHTLLDIQNEDALPCHPAVGFSWEGYVTEQLHLTKKPELSLYFWRTHAGAEIDLVAVKGTDVTAAIEIKYSMTPRVGRGFYEARKDLGMPPAWIIYPGEDCYRMKDDITVCGLKIFVREYLTKL